MGEGYKIAYGLEISSNRVVWARVLRRGAPQLLLDGDPSSDEAQRLLQSVSREVEKGTAALASCAPAALTVIRPLRAPFASAQKAARVWASLLDVELPFPVESALCCYGPPRVKNGETSTLASAIRRSDLEACEAACQASGFQPTHYDAEALALWSQQTAEAPPARSEGARALVWLGPDHVTLVRGQGRNLMAVHVLRASPLADSEEDQKGFEQLWAARMQQILSAHLSATDCSEMDLWWAGPGAEDEARVARLRQALPSGLSLRQETHRQPSSFLARALARRALEGSGVNFKRGEHAHPAVRRKQARHLKQAYMGVVAAATLVLLLNGAESILRKHRIASVQRQLAEAARSITGQPVPRGQERLLVERAISRRDEETRPFRDALDADGMEGRLARVLEEATALDIEINRLALSPLALSIEGSATSIQAVEGLAERLRATDWSVQSDSPGLTPEGRQRFILKGTAAHEG